MYQHKGKRKPVVKKDDTEKYFAVHDVFVECGVDKFKAFEIIQHLVTHHADIVKKSSYASRILPWSEFRNVAFEYGVDEPLARRVLNTLSDRGYHVIGVS